jgi:hypothetical protein
MTATKRFLLLLGVVPYCAARALGRAAKANKLVWALGFAAIALYALTYDIGNSGVFELDGNATTQTTHDWDQVYSDSLTNPPGATSGALAIAFDTDAVNTTADDIFTGGGSKDISGIQSGQWLWTTGKPQGKDDITHSYAAVYSFPNGCDPTKAIPDPAACHLGLFVGVDRFDNSGDATMGFWFFQDSIAETTTKKQGGMTFSGQHKEGDLLLVSDFSIGGSVSTITAYKWVGNDATGGLSAPIVLSAQQGLAIVNGSTTSPGGWAFTNKSGANTFDHGEFLEEGVDLTAIFGANVPCFTTFLAETRSSTSTSATLSDFTLHSLPLCGISVHKTCKSTVVSQDGTSVAYTFTATVTNTGIGQLFNVSVDDKLPGASTTTNIPVLVPGPLAGKASASVDIPFTVTCTPGSPGSPPTCSGGGNTITTPLSVTNQITKAKAFTASTGGTEVDAPTGDSATCSASVGETVTIQKSCDQSANGGNGGATLVDVGGVIEVEVFYKAHVCNTGTPGSSSELTNITLVDDHGSPLTTDTPTGSPIASLQPGACTDVTGSYFPNNIDSSLGRFGFTDTIHVTSATALFGSNPSPVGSPCSAGDLACSSITCPICTSGACVP